MRFLIGIDDTDNLESRGTGYRARTLGALLEQEGLAQVLGISRHQLLVDERIRYTSHNSSLCLTVDMDREDLDDVAAYCREFLLRESSPGSDAGLGITTWEKAREAVLEYGQLAKRLVLSKEQAIKVAATNGIILQELTGDGGGIIGALAGIGLRAGGEDGRFVWLKGLRELNGTYSVKSLVETVLIDEVRTVEGRTLDLEARVDVGAWPRPILEDGKTILLVEEDNNESSSWRVAPKEIIKKRSE